MFYADLIKFKKLGNPSAGRFFKFISKENAVSYYFILFVCKRDETLAEIAIAKNECAGCRILFHNFKHVLLA